MADIVVIGLSITSSWGNGHATTYRALIKALKRRGHRVTFLERDVPWYADHRDLPKPPYCRVLLYRDLVELKRRFAGLVRDADAVIVGSYVPEGVAVGEWAVGTAAGPVAFYDIDTPVTLAKLARNDEEYLSTDLVAAYDLYLSFTGGSTLDRLRALSSPRVAPLYCSVDPEVHAPVRAKRRWRLGYLGTYSDDRQPGLERLLLAPARAFSGDDFVIAGPQYPDDITWPENVEHIPHLPPAEHCAFYCAQDFTLNVTRADMRAAGWSPSVRLFEAAACGVPIVSDRWEGLETFLTPGREVLVADTTEEALALLEGTKERERRAIAAAARRRILAGHTAAHRAAELEALLGLAARRSRRAPLAPAAALS
jgi:spore maturation protein CgeB